MSLEVGSLFSGIGGIELGFEREGFKTKWFIENNEYCQKVLSKNFPGAQIYGDITTIRWEEQTIFNDVQHIKRVWEATSKEETLAKFIQRYEYKSSGHMSIHHSDNGFDDFCDAAAFEVIIVLLLAKVASKMVKT